MRACLADADRPVMLTVDPANTRAAALYQSLGFVRRELVRGFYRPDEDRYLMVWRPPVSKG